MPPGGKVPIGGVTPPGIPGVIPVGGNVPIGGVTPPGTPGVIPVGGNVQSEALPRRASRA